MNRALLVLAALLLGCPPPPAPVSTAGLTVVNNCDEPLWVSQHGFPGAAVAKLAPDASLVFTVPLEGLASTRVWAKLGCDSSGQNCDIGQSDPPCPPTGCAPPVDSKVEATWACLLADAGGCAVNPSAPTQRLGNTTWWNASAVDGYTLPFTITPSTADAGCPVATCAKLALSQCPFDTLPQCNGTMVKRSLVARGADGGVAGCFSPCQAITYPAFGGEGCSNSGDAGALYCCPTPPVQPAVCSAGPVASTGYVALIHSACASTVYGYAYDDGVGLRQCAGSTHLTMKFGPNCR